ncbi:MAG: amidohydrolase [Lachnospiraceae bacterium]|nr:amidohydrolase [Lachnospiraceae bacterium]
MNIRFTNARIVTMDGDVTCFEGELWTKDDIISYVGKAVLDSSIQGSDDRFDRVIDCAGNVLMPSFKDAHTHSAMTGMRSYADDMPLWEWLSTKIFPLEAKLTADDMYAFTQLAALEYVSGGITAVFDMYMNPERVADALNEMGIRYVGCCDINKFGPSLEEVERRFKVLNRNDGFSSYFMGFHAEYTCTKELLASLSELAHKYESPVFTHNSETKKEVEECIERHGMTPTQLFESLDMFRFGGGGYHCVYMSDEDIDIFKKHDLTVVTNPGSNTKLASGIAPISRYLDEGINVAIGTDGPSSNNCLDMFREMFLVTGLAKLSDMNAAAVVPNEVLKMATVNGSRCMKLSDCDVLAEGKKADLIMIDMHQPNMQPINNITDNIVYSGSKTNIRMTMCNGKILFEDGQYDSSVDPEKIYETANALMDKYRE